MDIDTGGHTNLFDIDYALILSSFFFSLILFKLKFAIVHNAANRRNCLRSNLYKIQFAFFGNSQCLFKRNDSNLIPFGVDKTNFFVPNFFVDLMF